MAKLYGRNDAVDFAAANLVSFGGSFTRLNGQPIDKSSLWYPAYVDTTDNWKVVSSDHAKAVYKTGLERATNYAATNAAYVGQELAVVSFIYAEDGETETGTKVTFYGIQDGTGTLKELGAIPVGDGSTIEVDTEGKISLKGIAGLAFERDVIGEDGNPTGAKEEIKYQALLTKNGLTWVEPSKTTVEGLASLISALESRAAQIEANVSTNATAIGAEVTARQQADKAITDLIGDVTENSTVVGMIADTKSTLEGAIADEKAAREAAIGVASAPASGEEGTEGYVPAVEASGIHAVIEAGDAALETKIAEALQAAKDYADANDIDTVYDDTEVRNLIGGHETRLGALETAIGDENSGLIKGLADEITAREQGDADTLDAAKTYTDEEITGLDIVIEKKIVENVESDYIIIKNKAGTEVASVNAAKFVKDGMLDSAVYSTETKKLTLTWNTDAGKDATEIDLNDLVNTYIGSEHIVVGTDGKISITDDVALDSDLTALETAFNTSIESEAKARDDADKALGERIDDVKATADAAAVKTVVDAALELKADKTALDSAVETINGEIAKKADSEATTNALNAKLDKSEWENTKGNFAIGSEVTSQFTTMGQRIDLADEAIEANTEAIEALEATVAETYATKTELGTVEGKADSNTNLITNLTGRLDGIVAQGGEPNTINTIKVNGVAQAITEKTVDITVPVIADTKVSQLNDGQALLDRVNKTEADIISLGNSVSGNQTGIATLTNKVSTLETAVTVDIEARLDSLEGTQSTLVSSVATNTTDIGNLKTRDTELAALIQGNTDKFADYQTKADAEAQHRELSNAIANVDLSSRLETTVFEAYKTSQAETIATLATKAEVAASFEATNAEVAKKANAADVYTKTEADAAFMTKEEVKATIDEAIAEAVDTDTLEGLVDLVEYVHENAGELTELVKTVNTQGTAIETNASAIAANKAAHEKNATDIAALVTAVAAQKVIESTEISVSEVDGGVQLGIKEVNVNKLVQTEGEVLVLNGGSATI